MPCLEQHNAFHLGSSHLELYFLPHSVNVRISSQHQFSVSKYYVDYGLRDVVQNMWYSDDQEGAYETATSAKVESGDRFLINRFN